LWGLALPEGARIELSSPAPSHFRIDGVTLHRRSNLAPMDITVRAGIPATSPARTLIDCAGRVDPSRLDVVVDDAVRRKLVGLPALRACHARVATGPGRRPTLAMRAVLAERAPGYDPGGSDRERRVLRVLAAADLPLPVQQFRVRIGRRTYILDYAYPNELVALEFDGFDTHGTVSAFHRDRERGRALVAAGWALLQVTARTSDEDLVAHVRTALAVYARRCGPGNQQGTQSREVGAA
jgi:very-short-patch-repair endonuclease